MRLVPTIAWRLAARRDQPVDARLLPLLTAIRARATLRAAAAEIGLSYRAAWSLLGDSSRLLGVPLVELERGRGARLTAAGERLLAADARATQRLRDAEPAIELAPPAPRAAPHGDDAGLVVAASHDLLLAALYERWARSQGVMSELAFKGSSEGLAAFARGEADVAGFHVAIPVDDDAAVRYRRLLDPRRHVLVRFAEREQGLIVPKGNPRGLQSLADVAAKHARFVNRQRGSGTRLLADQLLERANLAPSSIRGYADEEYTHLAVAAIVGARRADVGLGLKAAATRFGLGFVPLRRETYWLALRARRLESDAARRLLDGLAGEPLRRAARGLPGYSIRDAGAVTPIAAALR